MDSDSKNLLDAKEELPVALTKVLTQSEQVKTKVEECAQELSSVNTLLKEEITMHLPLEDVELALSQSEQVESKVQECASDLHAVNRALAREIIERKKIENRLVDSETELLNTQAALSDTQTTLADVQTEEERVRYLAFHDLVTGLPNRALFNERFEHVLRQAERHAWDVAVMFIDLDKFKCINDSYGHDVGDKVLQMVAARLQASVRAEDTVSRQGGDEFLYLLVEVKDKEFVIQIAEKIIATISETFEIDGATFNIRPSIGIAFYPGDGITAQALLKNADTAMYHAKKQNTGYFFFSQLAAA